MTARIPESGVNLLRDPALNKGTAFSDEERDALGLRGLLPPHVCSPEQQLARVLENLRRKSSALEKYIDLRALHDRNEMLFFRLLMDYPDEVMPIIYTPTVGLACLNYGHIYQRPRGIFVSAEDRGRVKRVLGNWPSREVKIIVVTDGERILGLGDQGANGMVIPVGKLALYTACAGIHPAHCLPVLLDVGTNNAALRRDPLYLGLPQERVRGASFEALVDEFVAAAREVFPDVLIQFEDFANHNAFRLLERYRGRIPVFNDDIQGTAAVTLAGLLSALRIAGGALKDQRLLFLGAGEAAIGIADLTVSAMMRQGLSERAARERCWLFDSKGLVIASRIDLDARKRRYAHERAPISDFCAAVKAVQPTAIIGAAAVPGAFTREVIAAMAAINVHPIVFALSNPTSQSECTAEQAYAWSGNRALFAAGSPFDAIGVADRMLVPRQANNSYVFPGIGLGAIVSGTRLVTDAMFMAAAYALAERVTAADLSHGSLYPPLSDVRAVSAHIAAAVARVAYEEGLATVPQPEDLLGHVKSQMYEPRYPSYTG
ncbi:MAG: NAD-dependent malic enzyme [Betaproteobacteria bacterium]|nr:MAG: NAD-dependent malic enzyme [Betaproteobacteria bacterium]